MCMCLHVVCVGVLVGGRACVRMLCVRVLACVCACDSVSLAGVQLVKEQSLGSEASECTSRMYLYIF